MVVYRDLFFQPLAEVYKFKSFSLTFSFSFACSVIFSQYPNLHNSYVNYFIDSFNCQLDAASVLMEYCPESCLRKVKDLCINGTWNSLLIHGFSLVNARLLMAFGTAFYAITVFQSYRYDNRVIICCSVQWSAPASSGTRNRDPYVIRSRKRWPLGYGDALVNYYFVAEKKR